MNPRLEDLLSRLQHTAEHGGNWKLFLTSALRGNEIRESEFTTLWNAMTAWLAANELVSIEDYVKTIGGGD